MRRFVVYVLRWQLSAVVMAPFMGWFEPYTGAMVALFACQFVGSLIFYPIDRRIFKGATD